MSKLKLVFTVLFIATVVLGIAFYVDFQSYHKLLQKSTVDGTVLGSLIIYFGSCRSGQGIFLSGSLLLIAWLLFIAITLGENISTFVADIKRALQNKKRS